MVRTGRVAAAYARPLQSPNNRIRSPAKSTPATTDRLRGYRQILGAQIPDSRVVFSGWDSVSGAAATRDLLERHPDIEAILCGSDRIALGALATLAAAGRIVPADVAVVRLHDRPSVRTFQTPVSRRVLRDAPAGTSPVSLDAASGRASGSVD
ncbi:substrate-binding domain-containing protein [Tessaracoccus flavescens]|uniref:substrate-binding domain-containing protein n=1 Tax=Tessaracoccus flavescens TaxID=399497 RepID=UPI00098501E0|nr:substrate-binding domain-containing protein [Tessaracoccus flavescens]